jgi:AraC family transcriptional activator of pyochelin receptor
MELIEANKKIFHTTETAIPEMAVIRSYNWPEPTHLDLEAGETEIILFCVRQGHLILQASFIPHPIELNAGDAVFLANPRNNWSVKLISASTTDCYVSRMEVKHFHQLINPQFDTQRLKSEQRFNWRDLMRLIPVSPAVMISFDQLLHQKLNTSFQDLFQRAKFLEIFSLLMESAFGSTDDVCPVAMSPVIEHKLSQVRHHIMDHLDEVPDPEALALQYELPRHTLKEGYKFKFGKTIYQFHADFKLERAMEMLASGEMLVKEVAFSIGYQNPSHFISAFKKKFGFTPKQFLKRDLVSP